MKTPLTFNYFHFNLFVIYTFFWQTLSSFKNRKATEKVLKIKRETVQSDLCYFHLLLFVYLKQKSFCELKNTLKNYCENLSQNICICKHCGVCHASFTLFIFPQNLCTFFWIFLIVEEYKKLHYM